MFALSGLTGGALMGSNPNTNTNNKSYKLLQDLPCRAQQTLAHGRLPYTQTARQAHSGTLRHTQAHLGTLRHT